MLFILEFSGEWHINGWLHRDDGPAVEWGNTFKWYLNGKLHREDGPAVEYTNGEVGWALNGKRIPFDEWLIAVKASDEQKIFWKLQYGG